MRIIDNAMPNFAEVQDRILAPGFAWYYARATKKTDEPINPYLYGWVHLVFDDGKWFSDAAQLVGEGVLGALAQAGEPVKGVFRIRLILNTISDRPYLNGPHVDLLMPHKTALIYLNDADGPTLIYNERWSEPMPQTFTVGAQVEPVANRMAIFDGQRFHTGTTPTRTPRRIVLNINYE